MSTLRTSKILPLDGESAVSIPGSVIQVVSSDFTGVATGTGVTPVDTGLAATITPKFSNSKIYINGFISVGSSDYLVYCHIVRGSTQLLIGDVGGTRPRVTLSMTYSSGNEVYNCQPLGFSYLDSPNTTSATTYKIQIRHYTTNTWYVNRTHQDREYANLHEPRCASTIALMEIAQ